MDEKIPVGDNRNCVDGMDGKVANDANGSHECRPATTTTFGVEGMTVVGEQDGPSTADINETQCGLGSWRPTCLRPFGTIWYFTAAVSMLWVIEGINFSYYSAVIPQVERRFGMSSSLSGFIRNVDNVGYMVVILAVSHLGRYANKPRILAASSLLSAVSILIFAVPHFIYGGPGHHGHLFSGNASSAGWNASTAADRRRGRLYEVCDDVDETVADPGGCGARSSLLEFNEGALALFVLSQLMLGIALSPTSSLTMTYMDDNVRDQSPKYFGTNKFLYAWLFVVEAGHYRSRSGVSQIILQTRRWHVTISCQPDGRPPQPVRPWKSGRVHLA